MTIGQLTRWVPPLSPDDGVTRALEAVRRSSALAAPVAIDGRLVGMVTEEALVVALHLASPDGAREPLTVAAIMREPVLVPEHLPAGRVAADILARGDMVVAAVDAFGRYRGLLARSDLLAAAMGRTLPKSVGGMATPLGVYLTTGRLHAGAGHLGLALTGVALMLLNYLSVGAVYGLAYLVQSSTRLPLVAIFWGAEQNWWAGALSVLQLGLFLLFLRWSPLAGYHAAEHQTVHAIEAGEELTLAVVRRMPRAHPRCGTNLMAMVIIISIAVPMLQAVLSLTGGRQDDELSALAFVAVMVLLLVSWRWLGRMLQNHITTRPASDRQLRSAIRAGEELLARFRQGREAPPRLYTRIWNMGILQVAAGLLATLYVGDLVARLFVR